MGNLSVLLATKCVKDVRTLNDYQNASIEDEALQQFVRGWYYGRGMHKVICLAEFTAYIYSALYDGIYVVKS